MFSNDYGKSLNEVCWRPTHFAACLPLYNDQNYENTEIVYHVDDDMMHGYKSVSFNNEKKGEIVSNNDFEDEIMSGQDKEKEGRINYSHDVDDDLMQSHMFVSVGNGKMMQSPVSLDKETEGRAVGSCRTDEKRTDGSLAGNIDITPYHLISGKGE